MRRTAAPPFQSQSGNADFPLETEVNARGTAKAISTAWLELVKGEISKTVNPFPCFNSSPEVIRMAVMLYVRYPLSLRNIEDLLFERGIDVRCGHSAPTRVADAWISALAVAP